eukprot:Hpha_TRINITY_DN29112_c0_g1::TRINITY_DN29112_c0_g1_i1::g.195355::m.195355
MAPLPGGGPPAGDSLAVELSQANADLANRVLALEEELQRRVEERSVLQELVRRRENELQNCRRGPNPDECPRCREWEAAARQASAEREIMLERLQTEKKQRRELKKRCRELEEALDEGMSVASARAASEAGGAGQARTPSPQYPSPQVPSPQYPSGSA